MKPHFLFMSLAMVTASSVVADVGHVVFHDDFEGANETSWRVSSKHFSYVAGEGVKGSRALTWEASEPVEQWETFGYSFPVECGRDYSYSIKARSAEDIIGRVYVRLACVMTDGRQRAFSINGRPIVNNGWKRGGKWVEISGCTPPVPPGASKGILEIAVMSRTTGKMFFDDLEISAGEKTTIRYLQSSAYRDEAVDGTVKFAAYYGIDPATHPLAYRQAFFAYKGKDGGGRRIKVEELEETFFTATIPVVDMAEGRHDVKAILTDANGKELDCAVLPFTRTATLPPRRVRFDNHQRMIVDGKPFFPLGCCGCGKDDAKTDLYASFPFNCTLAEDPAAAERAKKHGLKVIWTAGITTGSVSRALARWKDDPDVIAWFTADEIPIGFAKPLAQLKLMLHEADPDRPAFTVLDNPLDSRALLASFDVIGTDPYPVCNPKPIETCTGYPLKTREMTFGMRPIWQVPQAFDWHWHRRSFRRGMTEHHFPTRNEFMSMAWQPIAAGVKGLLWYDFDWFLKDIPKGEYEATLGYFRETVRDIARYLDVFLSVEPVEQPKTSAKGVTVRSWRVGDKRYLLTVNTLTSPVRAEVSTGGAEVKSVHAEIGDVPSASAGQLVFDLPALGFSFVSF